MKKILFAFVLLACCGCGQTVWTLDKTTKVDNIEAVFLNRPNDYTVLVRDKNELIAKSLQSSTSYAAEERGQVRVFTDAKGGMWAEIRTYKDGGHGRKVDIDIHIRNTDDVQGGQWREKIGKGPEHVGGVNRIK